MHDECSGIAQIKKHEDRLMLRLEKRQPEPSPLVVLILISAALGLATVLSALVALVIGIGRYFLTH